MRDPEPSPVSPVPIVVVLPATPPPAEVDPELLRRAQAGDEAAFGTLMRTHYNAIFRLVYSIVRHEHDARDVCQEIWLTVWRELPGFRGTAKFRTWLHPIAVRRALDHLRKRRRWYDRFLSFSTGDDAMGAVPEPAADVDTHQPIEGADRVMQVRRALEALPPKLRVVLALREIEGLTYEEIAQTVGVPAGTVMSRLYHARRQMAQKLRKLPS